MPTLRRQQAIRPKGCLYAIVERRPSDASKTRPSGRVCICARIYSFACPDSGRRYPRERRRPSRLALSPQSVSIAAATSRTRSPWRAMDSRSDRMATNGDRGCGEIRILSRIDTGGYEHPRSQPRVRVRELEGRFEALRLEPATARLQDTADVGHGDSGLEPEPLGIHEVTKAIALLDEAPRG